MLRMPLKPTRLTARDTVLMLPPPRAKWALFTSRSSLFVSATSRRISLVRLATLTVSELAIPWMRTTESDMAGKSLVRRMRRNRKASVTLTSLAWPPPLPSDPAPDALADQAMSSSRKARTPGWRCAGSRASARETMPRSVSSTSGARSSRMTSGSLRMR